MQLLAAIFGLVIFLIVLFAFLRIFRISDDVAAIRKLLSPQPQASVPVPSVASIPSADACPKCSAHVDETDTQCSRCGVILAKARSDQRRKV